MAFVAPGEKKWFYLQRNTSRYPFFASCPEHLVKECVVRYAVQLAVVLISDAAVWQTKEGSLQALARLFFELKM